MILNKDIYVPALRWRQGEYQALLRLSNNAKDRIVPFITIPDIEFDFEENQPKKTVHEHVEKFASRYKSKWGKRAAWVGIHENIVLSSMDDGNDIFTFVFTELRKYKLNVIPAIPLGVAPETIKAVGEIVKQDGLGVAISICLEDLMKLTPSESIQSLADKLATKLSNIDLIVDLGTPNFEPYEIFANALIVALRRLKDLNTFRNLVVVGTAMPKTIKNYVVADGYYEIPRHDLRFYQVLLKKLPKTMRLPNFGDYTIVRPDFTPMDMRKIKPSGKLTYTTPHNWVVYKGGAFRDNPEQMHGHCAQLIQNSIFRGNAYSSGDDYIEKCAKGEEGHSNQTWWKYVAINHHITQVLDDLSKSGDAS